MSTTCVVRGVLVWVKVPHSQEITDNKGVTDIADLEDKKIRLLCERITVG